MTAQRPTHDPKRVLVVGRSPEANRSVVDKLLDLGVAAEGCTQPEQATELFDANDFELVVFGRGILGTLSESLKVGFARQNPDVRFLDALAPVAAEQTIAALSDEPDLLTDLHVMNEDGDSRIVATLRAPCHLSATIYRQSEHDGLTAKLLFDAEVEQGPFEYRIVSDHFEDANSLLLTVNGSEYHLHPFLGD
jgi:hypothetical protein